MARWQLVVVGMVGACVVDLPSVKAEDTDRAGSRDTDVAAPDSDAPPKDTVPPKDTGLVPLDTDDTGDTDDTDPPAVTYDCDYADLEGTWTGLAGGISGELRLAFDAGADLDEVIGRTSIFDDLGTLSCGFDMLCKPNEGTVRVVYNELDPKVGSGSCVAGWYRLRLTTGGKLEVAYSEFEDGSGFTQDSTLTAVP